MSDKLYRTNIRYECETVAMENVLYFESALDAAGVTAAVISLFLPYFKKNQTQGTHITSVSALEISHLALDPDYHTDIIDLVGERSTGHSDPQLTACFRLSTGLSGRKRRGRFFMGGIPDEDVESGKLTAGAITNINAQMTTGFAAVTGTSSPIKLQVFSRTIYNSLTDIILDSYKPVTGWSLNHVMSTMRTRKPQS